MRTVRVNFNVEGLLRYYSDYPTYALNTWAREFVDMDDDTLRKITENPEGLKGEYVRLARMALKQRKENRDNAAS